MKRIFHFKDAHVSVGGKKILKDITFDIIRGQHVAISGLNGSGKTTLCKTIAGLHFPSKGSAQPIDIDYSDIKMISFTDEGKLFHSVNNVHYYQQRFNSWDADGFITAQEYLTSKGVDLKKKEHIEFIENFALSDLLNVERIKLSSGQTRKLLLTSAVLTKPKLLILDNPYIGLDTNSRAFLNNFLENLASQTDITIVLSGQFSILPKCISKNICIAQNTIVSADSVLPKTPIELKKDELGSLKRHYQKLMFKNTKPPSNEFISFADTSISYGKKSILRKFNWTVNEGDRWCLKGNNGSGKSSIVSMIYADHPQIYSQQIRLFGERFGAGRSIWDVKQKIGFTSPELHAYFRSNLTAEEVVWTGLFDKFELMGAVDEWSVNLSTALFDYFDMLHKLKSPYHSLSTGQQRICLLLRAMIKAPSILLLDEPFQGLDQVNVALSKGLIDYITLPEQALIFISHFEHELPKCITKRISLES